MDVIGDLNNFFVESKMIDGSDRIDQNTFILDFIDSLSIFKMIKYIETKYQIEIHEDDMNPENFENLLTIQNYVERKIRE